MSGRVINTLPEGNRPTGIAHSEVHTMMKKNYNVTGPERKEMAQVVGQAVGITPVYMKMPTCAYAIRCTGTLVSGSVSRTCRSVGMDVFTSCLQYAG